MKQRRTDSPAHPPSETKRCAKCQQTMAVSKFYPDKVNKSGYRPYCKACDKQLGKQRYDGEGGAGRRAKQADPIIDAERVRRPATAEPQTGELARAGQSIGLRQAHSDDQLTRLWLHSKSEHTQQAYAADVERFFGFVQKSLQHVILQDLQDYADSLAGLSANTRKRAVNSVKSLFTFGHKLGYLPFNVAAALKAPSVKNTLAERMLSESEVLTMIALTKKERDKLLLRLLYASAGRISEVCALKWRDVQPNGDSGQVTLFGKGGKTRAVKLSVETWKAINTMRKDVAADDPLFRSQKGGHLDPSQAWRIVRAAAKRAGIEGAVSPHWFRHSHASHALDRGASMALVRDTLGHSSLAVTSMYVHAKPDESSALHLIV